MAERNDAAYRRYIDQLSDLARSALPLYGVDTRADIGLLSHSENTVFRIEDRRAGFKAAMRIHRPNYQTRNAIQTELDWMRALNEAGIGTPQALPALDGTVLQRVTREPAGTRYVALFRWIDGGFPDPDKLDASQRHLGWLSARMHAQSRLAASRPFRAHGLGPRRHGGPGRALGTVGTRAGPDAGTARDPAPHRAIAGSTARCLRHGAGALRPDPCRPAQRQSAGGWRAHPCYRFR